MSKTQELQNNQPYDMNALGFEVQEIFSYTNGQQNLNLLRVCFKLYNFQWKFQRFNINDFNE